MECSTGREVVVVESNAVSTDIPFVDKSPVYLTAENIDKVHEPREGDGTVTIPMRKEDILKPESDFPEAAPRWDGEWYGTEESRLMYLRKHSSLWGFTAPQNWKRKTSVFFVPKKDGNLRKKFDKFCLAVL